MKFLEWLFGITKHDLVSPSKMEAKDPMDWKLTPNSRAWDTDTYCPQCKHSTGHREIMSKICNNCGFLGKDIFGLGRYRSYRKIWNGSKWVTQYKYGNGPNDFEIV